MERPSRIVTGDMVGRLIEVNKSNLEAVTDILHVAEGLDAQAQEKLTNAIKRIAENANTVSHVLLAARTARG